MIEEGSVAPDFTLPSDTGQPITLSELRGRKVVLYFYPKDNTPGCTLQACDFRDAMPRFDDLDAVVLGVSADSIESHARFKARFDLNFPLLADEGHAVASAYGVWRDRTLLGLPLGRIERSTFLIDEDGVVTGVWRKVNPLGHSKVLSERIAS